METESAKSTEEELLEKILAQVTANGQQHTEQNAEVIANLQLVMQQIRETKEQAKAARQQAEEARQQATESQEEIASMKKTLQGMQAQMGEMKATIAEQGEQITQQQEQIAKQGEQIAEQQGQIDKQGEQIKELQETTELLETKDPQLTRQVIEQETMKLGSEAKNVQLHFFKDDILDSGMYLIQQDAETLESESMLPKEIIEQLEKGNTVTLNGETIVPVMKENKDTGELRLHGMVTGEVIGEESDRQKFAEVAANYADVIKGVLNTAKATYFEKVAMYDPLTELSNKNGYKRYLQEDVLQALQAGEKVSMILIDGDKFKDINETYGHEAGDAVLKTIAETMRNCAGENACVVRDGGDEFLIVMPCDGVEAYRIAEQIRETIANAEIPVMDEKHQPTTIKTTISAGVAMFHPENPSKENIVKQAEECKEATDELLLDAKKGLGTKGKDGRLKARNIIKASPEIEEQLNLEREETPAEKEVTAEQKTNAMDSVEVIPFPEDTNELVSCTDGVYTAHVPVTVGDYAELLERAVPSSPNCPENVAEALKSAGENPHFEIVTDKDGANCELTVSVKDFQYAVCLTDDEKQQLGEMMQQKGIPDIINECIEEDKECAQNF